MSLQLKLHKDLIEAGLDEAGRGCLAGPVVAAAVILPDDFDCPMLNDSKKLRAAQRNELRVIIEKEALSYAVASLDNEEIDQYNILRASFKAMNKAIKQLDVPPRHLLIDGNRFYPETKIPFTCIVKGDGKLAPIAAASILAKTYRDEMMEKLHKEFPDYGWINNKGYPTKAHRQAIREHGACKYHRHSFRLLNDEVQLGFEF